jgi:hypothetical protein
VEKINDLFIYLNKKLRLLLTKKRNVDITTPALKPFDLVAHSSKILKPLVNSKIAKHMLFWVSSSCKKKFDGESS